MTAFNVIYNIIAQDKFSAVGKKFASVAKRIKGQVGRMNVSLDRAKQKFRSLDATVGKVGRNMRSFGLKMGLIATLPIALLGRSMINAASDAEETESKFGTVFKSIGSQADLVAKNLAKNYGLASSTSKQLLSDTGDLLTGFGFSEKTTLGLSNEIQKLAVDLASFTNFSGGAKGASAALTKALLGERESVKSLGISILEEDVKKKVALLATQGMTFATERQAKAFATLKIAQDQSKNALGDYARTSKDYANVSRLLDARLLTLREGFGKLMLPVMNKITKAFIKLAEKFNSLSPKVKKIIIVFTLIVAVIGPLLIGLGMLVAMLPFVAAGFAMISWPIVLIGLAIAAVIAIITTLIIYWGDLMELLTNSAVKLLMYWDDLMESLSNSSILAGLRAGFMALISPITFLIDAFDKIISYDFGNILGDISGFLGFGDAVAEINSNSQSQSKVDVNLNAPAGAIRSVKSRSSGSTQLNVGTNMVATAQ